MKKIVLLISLAVFSLYGGVIDNIKQDHKIRIGIKYDTKPFGFKDGKKIKGFDLDLSKVITEKIKQKYDLPKLKRFYKKVIPANRETMLTDGKVDMVIATYTITDDRKKKISFSDPYFSDPVVIVHSGKSIDGPVGVLKNSSSEKVVESMGYKTKELVI